MSYLTGKYGPNNWEPIFPDRYVPKEKQMEVKMTEQCQFKPGDKVRYKKDPCNPGSVHTFSNGQEVVTIMNSRNKPTFKGQVWIMETNTHVRAADLELVPQAPRESKYFAKFTGTSTMPYTVYGTKTVVTREPIARFKDVTTAEQFIRMKEAEESKDC